MSLEEKTSYTNEDEFGNKCPVEFNKKTGEVRVKKPPFRAYSDRYHSEVAKLSRQYPLASSIFITLVDSMDNTNAIVMSYDAMIEIFNKKRTSIYNAIKYLKEHQFINILKSGNMNVYCVNAQIVWSQSHEKIHFAKFNATVYVTANEQKKIKKAFSTEVTTK